MEKASAVFFIAFGLLVAFVVIPLEVDGGPIIPGQPGPAFLPKLLALGIALAAALHLLFTLLARPAGPGPAPDEAAASPPLPGGAARRWLAALAMALYAPAILLAGFFAASAAACAAMMLIFGERRVLTIVPVAVGVPGATWLFASQALNITLP